VNVVRATHAMAGDIVPFLAQIFGGGQELWQQVIGLEWGFGEDEIGYAMVDGARIVGFFGLHHSVRTIRGRTLQISAMHSVAVHPDYRGGGTSALVEAALRDTDRHYVAWTANPAMMKRYLKAGFRAQNSERCIVFPGASLRTLATWPWLRSMSRAAFDAEVDDETRRIFRDHRGGKRMREHLFRAFGEPLGLIIRRAYDDQRRYPVSEIAFVNNPALLRRCFEPIRLTIHRRERTIAFQINPPELGFRPARAKPSPGVQIFRSPFLTAGDFNQLYGELLVVG
jgi:GNAT superfamily N-acetyltransferase